MNFFLENSQLQNFDQNSAYQLVLNCYNRQLEQHHSSQLAWLLNSMIHFPPRKVFQGSQGGQDRNLQQKTTQNRVIYWWKQYGNIVVLEVNNVFKKK